MNRHSRSSLWQKIIEEVDGSKLALGIDPHDAILEQWNSRAQQETAGDFGLFKFSERIIDAYDEYTTLCLKPQSAFFEQKGSAGIAALEDALALAHKRHIPTILDVKRGDIGSTMQGYANAYLLDDAPLVADAITISPYLGVQSTAQFAQTALENERGVFLLCLTSNPEAYDLQHAVIAGSKHQVAREVFDFAYNFNAQHGATIGLVIGATIGGGKNGGAVKADIDLSKFNGPILSPGIGAQGAGKAELDDVFGSARPNVIPSVSRAVLTQGPDSADLQMATAQIYKELK
jgi:orotidine-5'-phosphate decarboxylase